MVRARRPGEARLSRPMLPASPSKPRPPDVVKRPRPSTRVGTGVVRPPRDRLMACAARTSARGPVACWWVRTMVASIRASRRCRVRPERSRGPRRCQVPSGAPRGIGGGRSSPDRSVRAGHAMVSQCVSPADRVDDLPGITPLAPRTGCAVSRGASTAHSSLLTSLRATPSPRIDAHDRHQGPAKQNPGRTELCHAGCRPRSGVEQVAGSGAEQRCGGGPVEPSPGPELPCRVQASPH